MLTTKVGRWLSSSNQRQSLRYFHPAQAHIGLKPINPVLKLETDRHKFLLNQTNIQFARLLSVASINYQSVASSEATEIPATVIDTIINKSVPGVVSQAGSSETAKAATEVTFPLPSTPNSSVSLNAESIPSTETLLQSSVTSVPSTVESVSFAAVPPVDNNELILDFIPEKPVAVDTTTVLGEPSFESLDLASWWPSGRLQYFMEYVHLDFGLEWWQTIILTTVCVRILVFPLVVNAQKNIATMNNCMPGMAKIQQKLTDARRRGDMYETAQLGQQLQVYMKKEGINPLKNLLPVCIQAPIFMSMFLGLRGMANCPVPSMEEGGLFWFENLAMADPFYLLPILTSTTLYLQLKLGTEGASLDTMGPIGKRIMTVLPFVLVPVTMNFPAAVTFYWFCTNVISVVQGRFVRLPAVRKKLGIPEFIKWDKNKMAGGKKGFKESIRETIDNWKVQNDIVDRRLFDEQQFRDAGSQAPVKTYKFDPTKPINLKVKSK